MKSTPLIIVAVLIITGGVWFAISSKDTALAPASGEVEKQVTTNEAPAPSEMPGMTAEEHAKMMDVETPTNPTIQQNESVPVMIDHSKMNMGAMDHSTMNMQTDSAAKVFKISGKNFAFDVTEIRVKEGDTVTIKFTSADGFHDLVIDEFSARTEKFKTGGMGEVTFVADKKGTFEYYCSVGQHRMNGMVGKLIVE